MLDIKSGRILRNWVEQSEFYFTSSKEKWLFQQCRVTEVFLKLYFILLFPGKFEVLENLQFNLVRIGNGN